jgi:hypothetical protein
LQDPPKLTRILIFGLKTYHLATLDYDRKIVVCVNTYIGKALNKRAGLKKRLLYQCDQIERIFDN